MGEAKKRKAAAANKSATLLEHFAAANTPGALTVYALECDDLLRLFASAAAGNETNAILTRLVVDWAKMVVCSKRGSGPLCINPECDHEFAASGEFPAAVVIALPFAKAEGLGSISGVCLKCAKAAGGGEGLLALGIRSYRRIWPDCREIKEGHA